MEQQLIGATIGGYRLERLIGRGGMSRVYQGFDPNLRRPVAVKVLDEPPGNEADFGARFRQEALILARLQHPNIVRIYDFGACEGLLFMVQELLPGPTLQARLAELGRRGLLPARDEVVGVVVELAAGLDAAHAAGVVHRDVKPGNAIWSADGRLVLTDFGIAKSSREEAAVTRTGILCGTPAYLSPEQANGGSVSPASDIYALGVVVYEMLTGRTPFEGPTPLVVALKHAQAPPPPLRNLRPEIAPEVAAVVDQALSKDPAARFTSAGALARALAEAWAAQGGEQPAPAVAGFDRTTALEEAFHISPRPAFEPELATRPVSPSPAGALRRRGLLATPIVLLMLLLGGGQLWRPAPAVPASGVPAARSSGSMRAASVAAPEPSPTLAPTEAPTVTPSATPPAQATAPQPPTAAPTAPPTAGPTAPPTAAPAPPVAPQPNPPREEPAPVAEVAAAPEEPGRAVPPPASGPPDVPPGQDKPRDDRGGDKGKGDEKDKGGGKGNKGK